MTRSRLSKHHIAVTVIDHKVTFHNLTIWDKMKVQHFHEIPLKTRDLLFKQVLMCGQIKPLFSLIRITKIKPFFIPSYNLTPKQCILMIRQQLFENICRSLSLIIAQICEIPRRGLFIRLTSLCRCRLMLFLKDQVALTQYDCLCLAVVQPASFRLPQQKLSLTVVSLIGWCHNPWNV